MPNQKNLNKGNVGKRKSKAQIRARKRKRRLILLCLFILIPLILLASAAGVFYFKYQNSLEAVGDGSNKVVLTIEDGESFKDVMNDLENKKLIQSTFFAQVYAKLNHKNTYFAGMYDLDDGMDLETIFNHLEEQGNVREDFIQMTVPEGKWAKEVAQLISDTFGYDKDEIIEKWNDKTYIEELCEDYDFLDYRALNRSSYKIKLEGYLFPNTYQFKTDASIDEITRTFLDHFQLIYDKYKDDFDKSDYSVHELVTLASVVQFESSSIENMKKIAGVFYNRLNDGMRLQSSVTVCYALYDDFNDPMDCEVETDIDSPYNTYINPGLPIGPILNPGEDAILAVLEPTKSDYYYFAADIYGNVDGKIHYSKTYEEHHETCIKLGLVAEDEEEDVEE